MCAELLPHGRFLVLVTDGLSDPNENQHQFLHTSRRWFLRTRL